MYCEHCGAPLQSGTVFCTSCGNGLTVEAASKKKGSIPAFILILLLWLLPLVVEYASLNSLLTSIYSMTEGGQYFEEASRELRTNFLNQILLPNGRGLLLVVVLALCRVINVRKIGWRQLLTAVFVAVLCSEGLGTLGTVCMNKLGMEALSTYSMARSICNMLTLPQLWRWIILLVFLIALSHDRFPAGVVFGVCIVGLAAWSVASLNQIEEVMRSYSLETEHYAPVVSCDRIALIAVAITRAATLFTVLLAGKRVLRNGAMGLCAGVKLIGSVLLLLVLVFSMNLGVTGAFLVEPIIGLMIGCIGLCFLIKGKIKRAAA